MTRDVCDYDEITTTSGNGNVDFERDLNGYWDALYGDQVFRCTRESIPGGDLDIFGFVYVGLDDFKAGITDFRVVESFIDVGGDCVGKDVGQIKRILGGNTIGKGGGFGAIFYDLFGRFTTVIGFDFIGWKFACTMTLEDRRNVYRATTSSGYVDLYWGVFGGKRLTIGLDATRGTGGEAYKIFGYIARVFGLFASGVTYGDFLGVECGAGN